MSDITYKWSFAAPEVLLSADGLTNVVSKIFWKIEASVEGEKYLAVYSSSTNVPQPDEQSFTPFNELTEEQVISWVESIEVIAQVKEFLASQIELQANPVTALVDFPFANKEIYP